MKKFLCRFMAEDFFVIQITHKGISDNQTAHSKVQRQSNCTLKGTLTVKLHTQR